MKTRDSSILSNENAAFIKRAVRDPVLFAKHILGLNLWELQAQILMSVANYRRTAVKACHAAGKTFALAIAVLWWLARYRDGIVLTTSPTQRQVITQLWAEIHRIVARAIVPFPKLKMTEFKFRGEENFALGFSTNQTENFPRLPWQTRFNHRRRGSGDRVGNLGRNCRNDGWRKSSHTHGGQSNNPLRRLLRLLS